MRQLFDLINGTLPSPLHTFSAAVVNVTFYSFVTFYYKHSIRLKVTFKGALNKIV